MVWITVVFLWVVGGWLTTACASADLSVLVSGFYYSLFCIVELVLRRRFHLPPYLPLFLYVTRPTQYTPIIGCESLCHDGSFFGSWRSFLCMLLVFGVGLLWCGRILHCVVFIGVIRRVGFLLRDRLWYINEM